MFLILLFSCDDYAHTISKLKFYIPYNLEDAFCPQVLLFAFESVRVITSQRWRGVGKLKP